MLRLKNKQIKSVIALAILSGILLSACESAPSETPSQSTAEVTTEMTTVSETTQGTTVTSATTTASQTTETTEEETSEETDDTEETEETEETEPSVTSIENNTDIGYGSYGFMVGDVRFHSQNDLSMMIVPEDNTIYDHGARNINCSWIDTFYYEDSFDMTAFDASNRFLSFYNDDTSITFSPYKSLGSWTTPKGSELELYTTEITIITENLEIRILPHYLKMPEEFNISVNGRGYYVSLDQLQMVDFVLSSLAEEPGTDPLEGLVVGGKNHTYYF